jgi:hypothetical protein
MNLKQGDRVSAVALVVESENGNGNGRRRSETPSLEDEAPASRRWPMRPRRPRPPATA